MMMHSIKPWIRALTQYYNVSVIMFFAAPIITFTQKLDSETDAPYCSIGLQVIDPLSPMLISFCMTQVSFAATPKSCLGNAKIVFNKACFLRKNVIIMQKALKITSFVAFQQI